jgi:hypothetical protein
MDKSNVSSLTGSNDQKGRRPHVISGPRPTVSNHSGTSKRSNSEFMKIFYSMEKLIVGFVVVRHYTHNGCFQILNELSLQEIQMN